MFGNYIKTTNVNYELEYDGEYRLKLNQQLDDDFRWNVLMIGDYVFATRDDFTYARTGDPGIKKWSALSIMRIECNSIRSFIIADKCIMTDEFNIIVTPYVDHLKMYHEYPVSGHIYRDISRYVLVSSDGSLMTLTHTGMRPSSALSDIMIVTSD